MKRAVLQAVVWFCLIVGACLGVYAGYSIVPFSDSDPGPLFSCVILGAVFGGGIGGGFGATIVYVATAKRSERLRRIGLVLAVVLGVSLLLVYAFRREPVECDQIQEKEFRTLLKSNSANITQVKQLLANSSLEEDEIRGSDYGDGRKDLFWRTNEAEYSAHFRDNLLKVVHITWDLGRFVGLKPTVEEVVACFGSPDLYQATYFVDYDGEYVRFQLWYLKEGIVVHTRVPYKNETSIIDGNVIMRSMSLTIPNSADEIIRYVYGYGEDDEVRSHVLETLYLWPGSWEEIVVRGCRECPD